MGHNNFFLYAPNAGIDRLLNHHLKQDQNSKIRGLNLGRRNRRRKEGSQHVTVTSKSIFIIILLVGAFFRLYGINWDQGYLLHPDERFIVSVVEKIKTPTNLKQYLDSRVSPLNPRNRDVPFYVYGDLPISMARLAVEGMQQFCVQMQKSSEALGRTREDQSQMDQSGLCGSSHNWTDSQGIVTTGRVLSALFGLGTLVWIFLIANSLYGQRTALAAMFLGSIAVLPVQLSHFFTADVFATFFICASAWFLIRAKGPPTKTDFVLAGAFFAMALACRINLLLFAVVFVPGIGRYAQLKSKNSKEFLFNFAAGTGICLISFFAILHLSMPSAFSGFFTFEQRWLAHMKEIWAYVHNQVIFPPNVQWTNRTPWLFPLVNMVFWGMGLPLALTALTGWFMEGWHLLAKGSAANQSRGFRNRVQGLISARVFQPWLWIAVFFLWQGSFFITTMRYFLPLYPFFILFAGHLLVQWWDSARPYQGFHFYGKTFSLGRIVAVMTVLLTTFWVAAFIHVYQKPHTRVAASEWITQHIPVAINLVFAHHEESSGEHIIPLPGPEKITIGSTDQPAIVQFLVPREGTATSLRLHRPEFSGEQIPTSIKLQVTIATDYEAKPILTRKTMVMATENLPGDFIIPLSNLHLSPGQTYRLSISTRGPPLTVHSSAISSEYWDDALPLRNSGQTVSYRRVEMDLYREDTGQKYQDLLNWLEQSDYIVLSSNRLYASIPRQPLRYPLTSRYYKALFSGTLGFEKIAEFTSYPALGPFLFPDQESTRSMGLRRDPTREEDPAKIYVPMSPAEEAFSVYDHPRVLVFKKNGTFSRENITAQLGGLDLETAYHGFKPVAESAVPDGYLLKQKEWKAHQQGGTWSRLFGFENTTLSVLSEQGVWLLFALLLGWFGFPLIFPLLPGLADRGFGISRPVSLLFIAYVSWLFVSLNISTFTRNAILAALFPILALSLANGIRNRSAIRTFLCTHGRMLLTSEAVFFLTFLGGLALRSAQPELWHPSFGGEKPMDLSYLTAILKSTTFPPYDPWYSGGYLNYYYFGFLLVSIPGKLIGSQPSITYNIALALWFALSCQAAFSIAFNLHERIAQGRKHRHIPDESRITEQKDTSYTNSLRVGLLAVLLTMFAGNLGQIAFLVHEISALGQVSSLAQLPALSGLANILHGAFVLITGNGTLDLSSQQWFWNASRIIPVPGGEITPITEFPFFSFLYGDLHAHYLALPLSLAFLSWALSWLPGHSNTAIRQNPAGENHRLFFLKGLAPGIHPLNLVVAGLLLGSLYATNSWLLPVSLIVSIGALILRQTRTRGISVWLEPLRYWLFMVFFSWLLFLPFTSHFTSAHHSIGLWTGSKTPLTSSILAHGLFLFPIYLFLYGQLIKGERSEFSQPPHHTGSEIVRYVTYGILIIGVCLILLRTLPIILLVGPLLLLATLSFIKLDNSPGERFLLFLVSLACAILVGVEVIVMQGDIGRMNTVFKFYYQAWTLLSITAAVSIGFLWTSGREKGWKVRFLKTTIVLIILSGLLYPPLAINAKMAHRFDTDSTWTLDGMRFMKSAQYNEAGQSLNLYSDYQAIRWLQQNVEGSPVIATGRSSREYLWGSRVTVFTGLPGILGWLNHQKQQKSLLPQSVLQRRIDDTKSLYSGDPKIVETIINRYGIGFIYYGELERTYYSTAALKGFETLEKKGILKKVYSTHGVKIYKTQYIPTRQSGLANDRR